MKKTATLVNSLSKNAPFVFHGTGNLESIISDGFKAELTGKGNDQMGSGFYFTTDNIEANGYACSVTPNVDSETEKIGGNASPGVLIAHLDIKNPIVLKGGNLNDVPFKITEDQAFKIMMQAPGIFDLDKSPLGNWFEVSPGRPVTPAKIRSVSKHYTGASMIQLENDFFRNNSQAFRMAVNQVLGFDGVVHEFENGKTHWVAWFSEQIYPASFQACAEEKRLRELETSAENEAWIDRPKRKGNRP